MSQPEVSATAIGCAVARGLHRLRHARPWILDDPYAEPLVGSRWESSEHRLLAKVTTARLNELISAMVVRTRYTEDRLRSGAFTQYVLLGAGLDSVAFRGVGDRPVRILEVDEPGTQCWKRERVERLGLPLPPDHVFVPVDFEVDDFCDALDTVGIDWTQPTLVSWLGVTQYLTRETVHSTLRRMSVFASRSEIVFTYQAADSVPTRSGRGEAVSTVAAAGGEPYLTWLAYEEAAALTADSGLRVCEHLTNEDMRTRYFSGRSDVLGPPPIQRTVAASVDR